ncbi:MAG: excinuclease ABC subunit UvrC [Rhodospirillales bacterium]|nr:excinuclease ABC subunit UvrC [Rhodospirillales bacterium]
MKGKRQDKDPTQGGKRAVPPAEAEAEETAPGEPQQRGIDVLRTALKTLPASPGVYRMINRRGDVLYVGKARHLKRRVTTYTQPRRLPIRLQRMVSETVRLEVITTASEVEALLLESNLIKRHRPRYNVLLRDDKSFPYIVLTKDGAVPRLAKHRGAHKAAGDYFGPFASAGAVNRTIAALEKAFLLRSCSDAVYLARTRPCLLYQIKRCSAPCVGRISEADYAGLVVHAKAFLKGQAQDVKEELAGAMQAASEALDFEQAARYRDRLRALAHIQAHQDVNLQGIGDADVVAALSESGVTSVQVFFFRADRNYGNRAYFPAHDKALDGGTVLAAFLAQFYDDKPPPPLVLCSHPVPQQALIAEALSRRAGRKVTLAVPQRGTKRSLMQQALTNAREALSRRLAETSSQHRLLTDLAEHLGLEGPLQRIEIYDNSHIQGSNSYGAMAVAGPEGFVKQAYRQFGIRGKAEGDDYAMMAEVFTRRFTRQLKEDPDRDAKTWPDLAIIDGGRGQLRAVERVLEDLGIDDLELLAVAKGPDRDAGRERLFRPGREPLLLEPCDPLLYFIQRLRDEAHRFAIGTHRHGRTKSRLTSILDDVPGIGAKRKKALLLHFGSAQAVSRAGPADLAAVSGISHTVAQKIHDHFHSR